MDRRGFIRAMASGAVGSALPSRPLMGAPGEFTRAVFRQALAVGAADRGFSHRGIVLCARDLEQPDWPELFKQAELNVLGIHLMTVAEFAAYAASPRGAAVLRAFEQAGVAIEFEHHVMSELLPRELFAQAPEMFRMDEKGQRVKQWNFCCSSDQAIAAIHQNAEKMARRLPMRTGRYFFWPDDGAVWCKCPKCRDLTESDQNLIMANTVLEGVRRFDPKATACCLAYAQTLPVPRSVRPLEGIFLEFAPIHRSYQYPINSSKCAENIKHLRVLEGLLTFFGTKGSQALEYWLDASRFSGWKRPSKRIPDLKPCLDADMDFYRSCGFESVTTFGVYLDPDYWRMYGPPPIVEYGRAARRVGPTKKA